MKSHQIGRHTPAQLQALYLARVRSALSQPYYPAYGRPPVPANSWVAWHREGFSQACEVVHAMHVARERWTKYEFHRSDANFAVYLAAVNACEDLRQACVNS